MQVERQRYLDRRRNALVQFSRVWIWPLGLVLAVILFFRWMPLPLKHVFTILFLAVLVSAAVSWPARFLSRYHIPKGITIFVCYLLAAGVLALAVWLIIPLIISEIGQFQTQIPTYANDLQKFVHHFAPQETANLSAGGLFATFSGKLTSILGQLTGIISYIISLGVDIVLVLALAFFMANDDDFAGRFAHRFIPSSHRERVARVLGRIGTRLGNWAGAQLLLALYFGIAFGIGLKIIGIDYAVTLAVIGGILEVVPYVGGFITMVLAVLVALTHDPIHAALVLGWYSIVAETEAHIVHPKLMNHVLQMHPAVIVVALFIGGESLGLIGALLAVPIAIIIRVILDEFYHPDDIAPGVPPDEAPIVIEQVEANGRRPSLSPPPSNPPVRSR